MTILTDTYNRKFKYLRLSLTERCNFKCKYCLPFGYSSNGNDFKSEELNLFEIKNLCSAFANLGIEKIRLTGGEPTLRQDLLEIIKIIKSFNSIKNIALTTNGLLLEKQANLLLEAGITNINISIDSLNQKVFQELSGFRNLKKILKGLEVCLNLPFKKIKINSVLLKQNLKDIQFFLDFIVDKNVDIRFIELMPTSINKDFFAQEHINSKELKDYLLKNSWEITEKDDNSGPANMYSHKGYKGKIGLIAPYSEDFCDSCNRLRVNSKGDLQLCLFGEGRYNLKSFLKSEDTKLLENKIIELLKLKPKSHFLKENILGFDSTFSKIGG